MENSSTSPPSQLSPTRWPANAFSVVPSLLTTAGLVASIVVGYLAGSIVAMLLGETPADMVHQRLSLGLVVSQFVFYVPIVAFVVVMLPRIARRSLAELGLGTPKLRDLAYGAGGAMVMFLVVSVAVFIQERAGIRGQQTVVKVLEGAHPGMLLDLLVATAVVVAPFVEEFVFRGFVFNALLRRLPFLGAALISGLLFALAHGEKLSIAPLTMGGVVLAWVYFASGSLWASMLTHALFNAVEVLGIFASHAPHG